MPNSDSSIEHICHNLGIAFVEDLKEYPHIKEKRPRIPYSFAKERKVLSLDEEKDSIHIAFTDPLAMQTLQELRVLFGKKIIKVCCSKEVLEQAIEYCFHKQEERQSEEASIQGEKEEEEYDLLEENSSHPTISLLNSFFREGIMRGASDIHFEPQEDGVKIRYRVDGILQEPLSAPKEYATQIMTRIKVMSKLDIAEKRLPQDGRMKLFYGEREINFRVSTIPVVHGERIVLRILDRGNILLGLDKIGMPENLLSSFRRLTSLSEGMVLVTGPTGSGKTTTLYSALSELPSLEKNIMTIEDPVEYKLNNISQIGVNPKTSLTFSSGLKHILRQDPDVIMVGEIRDMETAHIAVQAALTGHLVFSTLHTNDASSAVTRLADMGIEPYLISSSIGGVLAQRLVRKICRHCVQKKKSSKAEGEALAHLSWKGNQFIGKGCQACHYSGYAGRTGVYELIMMNSQIKRAVLRTTDSQEIKQHAMKHSPSLLQSGLDLVSSGITTLEEVLRVTNIDSGE